MRLRTAIYIIETSYGILAVVGLVSIVATILTLKAKAIITALIILIVLAVIAFYVKLFLINIYLKRCKYPYEFWSVLVQLKLTEDVKINWTEDLINRPKDSQNSTQSFLEDNNLVTEIGKKTKNISIGFLMMFASLIGLIYFSQKTSFNDNPVIFIGILLFIIASAYLWKKGKKQENETEPILSFIDKGLVLNDSLYHWDKIKSWLHKGSSKYSSGEMVIIYKNSEFENSKLIAELDKINIDRIDFMLLLTHFKAKYG